MPKGKKKEKANGNETSSDTPFSEMSHWEQLQRAKSAKETATTNMKAARKSGDKKKEEGATKAWNAANRVINRLGEATPPAGDRGKEGRSQARGAPKTRRGKMGLADVANIAKKRADERR